MGRRKWIWKRKIVWKDTEDTFWVLENTRKLCWRHTHTDTTVPFFLPHFPEKKNTLFLFFAGRGSWFLKFRELRPRFLRFETRKVGGSQDVSASLRTASATRHSAEWDWVLCLMLFGSNRYLVINMIWQMHLIVTWEWEIDRFFRTSMLGIDSCRDYFGRASFLRNLYFWSSALNNCPDESAKKRTFKPKRCWRW